MRRIALYLQILVHRLLIPAISKPRRSPMPKNDESDYCISSSLMTAVDQTAGTSTLGAILDNLL